MLLTSLIRWVLGGVIVKQHAANQPDMVGSGEVTACCPPA